MTKTRSRVGAAACAVFSALGLAACAGGEVSGERARIGRTFETHVTVSDLRNRSSFELPTGRLSVGLDVLPALKVDDPESSSEQISLLTPRNGSFVQVAWSWRPAGLRNEVIDGDYGFPDRPDVYDSLTLVVGGERYPLSSGDGIRGVIGSTTWTVAGDAKDARIAVAYDGVVQSVDPRTGTRDAGRAASLYDLPKPRKIDCGSPTFGAPFSAPTTLPASEEPFACEVQVRRVGYVTGRGWAPLGQQWLVIDLDLTHGDELTLVKAGSQINYTDRSYGQSAEATLLGQAGSPARGEYRSSDYGHTLYFAVSPKTVLPRTITVRQALGVIVTADLDKRDRTREQLDVSWTVPLR